MNTFEITLSAAKDVLPCLEAKRKDIANQIESLQEEHDYLGQTIAEWKAKINSTEALPVANGKPDGGRRPKGAAADAIYRLFSNLPKGEKLTVAEIVKRTGVKQPTVYRNLNNPKRNKGRFIQEGNEWRIK